MNQELQDSLFPSHLLMLSLTFVRYAFWQELDIHLCVSKLQSPQELEHDVEYSGQLGQKVCPTTTWLMDSKNSLK